MIKILNDSLQRLGVIKYALKSTRLEELNGENTLDFEAILDSKLNDFIDENSIFELDNDYFDIALLKKLSNADGTYTIEAESEHVSYRLNRPAYNVEYFAETGTPRYVLGQVLQGTGFTIGTIDFTSNVTYSAQEAKSRRQVLMEFVAYLGGEVHFNKFEISILQHRGSIAAKPVLKDRNVTVVSKTIDKRTLDANGNPTILYACTPLYLSDDTYSLGDNILLIQTRLGIRELLRVVRISFNTYNVMEAEFEFSNYVNGLADQLYRIETSSVIKGKLYNGCRIGPEFGFEVILSDNMARSYFNSTELKMQKGDGSGNNWTDALYFDPVKGEFIFAGLLSADQITAGTLNADVIYAGEITADQITAGTLNADVIYSGEISADRITSGVLDATVIYAGDISADKVTAGTLNIDVVYAGEISADKITSGTLNADVIYGGEISADNITAGTLDVDIIYAGDISATQVTAGSLNADVIYTGQISADQVAAGTLNAGVIYGGDITAGQVKAGTLNSDVIYGGTITADKVTSGTLNADVLYAGKLSADQIMAVTGITALNIEGTLNCGNTLEVGAPNESGGQCHINTATDGIRVQSHIPGTYFKFEDSGGISFYVDDVCYCQIFPNGTTSLVGGSGIRLFVQPTEPAEASVNDVWIDTSTP